MAVKINNQTSNTNLILFSRCPQILSIDKTAVDNSKAKLVITVNTSAANDSKLTINSNTVVATDDIMFSFGNRFYCKNDTYRIAVALCAALNNIANLVKNYNIYVSEKSKVIVEARESGKSYNITVDLNECGFGTQITESTVSSSFINRYYIDVYKGDEYIATMQKINNSTNTTEIRFNLSNIIEGLSVYDEVNTIKLNVYNTSDEKYTSDVDNYILNIIKGYYANDGKTYIDINNTKLLLDNNYDYYMYNNNLRLTSLVSEDASIEFKYSDETTYHTQTVSLQKGINDIVLSADNFNKAYFIDFNVSGYKFRIIRINPPYAQGDYTRIYWHNSYGGISLFDFVGDKTIQRETDITTYYNTDLSFYSDTVVGNENVQNIVVSEKNTLTTHLMEDDKMQVMEDLRLANDAWIEKNGKKYKIIITNITYTAVNNSLSTANVTFRYSLTNFN